MFPKDYGITIINSQHDADGLCACSASCQAAWLTTFNGFFKKRMTA
jgi:hypothetical protein